MVNDIACTRLGYTRGGTPLNVTLRYRVPIPSPEDAWAIAQMIRKRGHATFDAIYRRKDGTEFPVEISTHTFELRSRQSCHCQSHGM